MQESQIDTSTTERQLLYDIRAESRKTNELLSIIIQTVVAKQDVSNDLLSRLFEVMRPIAKDTKLTVVNPIQKRGKANVKNK